MPHATANAEWKGSLLEGSGRVSVQSATLDAPYDFRMRTGDAKGTNPEELLAAAHASCFAMQLSALLTNAGHPPARLKTSATAHLEKLESGFAITKIELSVDGEVPGLDSASFQKHAETAKAMCPVSKALAGVAMTLAARLA